MERRPTTRLWLQNNTNNQQRQQNQLRPNSGPNGQAPRSSSMNRWILIIIVALLSIYAYNYFISNNNTSSSQRDELTYSQFYDQVNSGNIKSAVFIGQNDIQGTYRNPPGA